MTNATSEELYWAAGFLEGEGSFTFSSSPRITCPQKQLEPVLELMELFGGSISKPDHCYRWRINGEKAIQIMEKIYPIMSPKRQAEIEYCLEMWNKRVPKGGRRPEGSHWDGKAFVA